jgi:hypothetical protein
MKKLISLIVVLIAFCNTSFAQTRSFDACIGCTTATLEKPFTNHKGIYGPVKMEDPSGVIEMSYGFTNVLGKWQLHTYTIKNSKCVNYMHSSEIRSGDMELALLTKIEDLKKKGFNHNSTYEKWHNTSTKQWAYLNVSDNWIILTISASESPIWANLGRNTRTHVKLREMYSQNEYR